MRFWNGTTLGDPVIERARQQCLLAEYRFHEAENAAEVDAAILEMSLAEEQFARRLSEIRDRFFRYGVIDWDRPEPRLRRRTRRIPRLFFSFSAVVNILRSRKRPLRTTRNSSLQ